MHVWSYERAANDDEVPFEKPLVATVTPPRRSPRPSSLAVRPAGGQRWRMSPEAGDAHGRVSLAQTSAALSVSLMIGSRRARQPQAPFVLAAYAVARHGKRRNSSASAWVPDSP
jgi:hypothetical protein